MNRTQIAIIGALSDYGAGRRGVDMGPSAIRLAGLNGRIRSLLGYEVDDLGNISAPQPESVEPGSDKAKYLPQIADTCQRVAEAAEKAADAGKFPLVLGGDHSIAIGSVSGMAQHLHKHGKKLGLIWVDAHADMNTPETTPSGNVHGMPLACLVGRGPKELTHLYDWAPKIDPRNVVLIGLRDVDPGERSLIRDLSIRAFTMRDIDERGLRSVMDEAVAVATRDTEGFHLSFDMDSIDPQEAPGVGTPVRGGFTYREAHLSMEMICDSGRLLALDLVEVNPVIDEKNRTAVLAVELTMSALGKRIL